MKRAALRAARRGSAAPPESILFVVEAAVVVGDWTHLAFQ
jgi:hypothetical protein